MKHSLDVKHYNHDECYTEMITQNSWNSNIIVFISQIFKHTC